jgi:meiotically up-regulated gene 157 (Mug157) protein
VTEWIDDLVRDTGAAVRERLGDEVGALFAHCYGDTLRRTLSIQPDGTAFMVTGDIPAMWLRDSTAQLAPYLHVAADRPEVADLLVAVNRRQLDQITRDPYANAFNVGPTGEGHQSDLTDGSPWVWERKYEIDSLCYPVQLAADLWRITGRTDHLDAGYRAAVAAAITVWRTEQDHEARSPYRFERPDPHAPTDTLVREGRGPLTAPTGMSWQGFRPSDDACTHGYNVPGNAFASAVLTQVVAIAEQVHDDPATAAEARALRAEIERGIAEHGVVEVDGRQVYAYEVDGRGAALLMDDANVPSLMSLPYLGWCAPDDPRYLATRAFLLSDANPTHVRGTAAAGIGSPHTPPDHVWPIALAVQGLTATDPQESARLLATLVATDAGTGAMHESFHKDDPSRFTRAWFSWADAMFCELALEVAGLRTYRRTLDAVRS